MLKAVLLAVVLVAFVEAWMEPEVCTSPPPPGEIPPLARLYYDQYCDSLKPGRGTPHLLNKGNFVPTEGERPPVCTDLLPKQICDRLHRLRGHYDEPYDGHDECLWVDCL
ncbi:hypothetical protein QR680_013766 [Steinernema hermaphroditum]|uniref:Secreted protein n=1 Tax=Steinernema hermaphroditum TaxID=289476 RepID=A0AA39M329_9BILA|nr:hypothetical protein QR680_013766 [Steinernema hermaphroditum]